MNRALWSAQVFLAVVFLAAGGLKLATPAGDLDTSMPEFPAGFGKVIGTLEVAGAVGMVVPAATGILPVLTPAAAGGLAVIMVGAAFTHLFRAEYIPTLTPVVLLGLAATVAYGRLKLHPVSPRVR